MEGETRQGENHLTTFQVHIGRIFFGLKDSHGFLVAGGAGLLASALINRSTQDIDLFASTPVTSVAQAKTSFLRALKRRGYNVELIHDSPTFCRLLITTRDDQLLIDLAIDSPPHDLPTVTVLGPTMGPRELAGRKLLALFGRAEARDFADMYVLAQRLDRDHLLSQAAELDLALTAAYSHRCWELSDASPTTKSHFRVQMCRRRARISPPGQTSSRGTTDDRLPTPGQISTSTTWPGYSRSLTVPPSNCGRPTSVGASQIWSRKFTSMSRVGRHKALERVLIKESGRVVPFPTARLRRSLYARPAAVSRVGAGVIATPRARAEAAAEP